MKQSHCDIHNINIIIFNPEEEYIFTENIEATIIFYDQNSKLYLKKFIIGKCDENCLNIRKILNSPESTFSYELFLDNLSGKFSVIERLELARLAPTFVTELQFKNFPDIRDMINYFYSEGLITEEQIIKLKNLFLEQNIDLDNL